MLKMFFLVANPVTSWFNNQIHRFLLWLDQSVYWFAAQCYQLFMKLSTAQIFTDDFFSSFAKRIYAILGVFMLFYLVYALLNAIVDPDKLTNDKGAGKIAVNLIISLTLLGLLPNIFDLAYRMQNFVLSSNLLGAVILGSDVVDVSDSESVKENNESLIRFGDYVSFTVLNSFLNPENVNPTLDNGYNWYGVKKEILEEGKWKNLPLLSDAVSNGASIGGENIVLTYRPIVSTAAGIFLIYMLLSFTLDLGVRVVKFAFYQLLAPIPIVLRIIPSKKGTFDKWLKQTLSVYFEVFVRVGLMYIAIYFINAITTNNTLMEMWTKSTSGKLALAIIIIGVFAFAKQAPKIISDVLGIDTGGLKLGIGDKLKAGGFFGAGAIVGAGALSGVRGLTHGISGGVSSFSAARNNWRQINSSNRFTDNLRFLGKGFASGVTGLYKSGTGAMVGMLSGTVGGAVTGYSVGKKAGNFTDMKNMTMQANKKYEDNRNSREIYRAGHGGYIGGVYGKVYDSLVGVASAVGINNIVDRVAFEEKFIKQFDDYKALYDNGKYQAITSRINELEAAKASGANPTQYGITTSFDTAINSLKSTQKKLRQDAITKNSKTTETGAYMLYNLANLIQTNSALAHELQLDQTIDTSEAKKIALVNNKVMYDGSEMDSATVVRLLEQARVNSKGELEGIFAELSTANNAKKNDTASIAYKEHMRKQDEAKKK